MPESSIYNLQSSMVCASALRALRRLPGGLLQEPGVEPREPAHVVHVPLECGNLADEEARLARRRLERREVRAVRVRDRLELAEVLDRLPRRPQRRRVVREDLVRGGLEPAHPL